MSALPFRGSVRWADTAGHAGLQLNVHTGNDSTSSGEEKDELLSEWEASGQGQRGSSRAPPSLGHEGMDMAERKAALGDALKWLRDEMVS